MSTTVNLGMLPQNRGQFTTATWPQNNISIYKDNIVQYNGSSYIYNPESFDIEHPEESATSFPPYNSTPASLNPGWAVFASGNNTFTTGQSVDELSIDAQLSHTSNGIPSSSEVFDKFIESGVFDLSAYNAVGGELATYTDLGAALTAMNSLSTDYKKGGMSIKFVQSSDNNSTQYVQYMYIGTSTAVADFTNVANWQGVDSGSLISYDTDIATKNTVLLDNAYDVTYGSANCRINVSGIYGNNTTYKHAYISVVPGEKYHVDGIADYVLRIAFATTNEVTSGGTIPVVAGTSVIEIPANTNIWITIPEGCSYLLLWRNDEVGNFVGKVKKAIGVDDEPMLGSKNLVTSGGVEKQLSKRLTNLTLYNYGILSGGTFSDSSSSKHAGIKCLEEQEYIIENHGTVDNIRYAFVTSIQATAGGAIPMVTGTSVGIVPANSFVKVTIPSGCRYLIFNNGSSSYSSDAYIYGVKFRSGENLLDVVIRNCLDDSNNGLITKDAVKSHIDNVKSALWNGRYITLVASSGSTNYNYYLNKDNIDTSAGNTIYIRTFDVKEGSWYSIQGTRANYSDDNVLYLWLDENNNVLAYNDSIPIGNATTNEVAQAPHGAIKLRVQGSTSTGKRGAGVSEITSRQDILAISTNSLEYNKELGEITFGNINVVFDNGTTRIFRTDVISGGGTIGIESDDIAVKLKIEDTGAASYLYADKSLSVDDNNSIVLLIINNKRDIVGGFLAPNFWRSEGKKQTIYPELTYDAVNKAGDFSVSDYSKYFISTVRFIKIQESTISIISPINIYIYLRKYDSSYNIIRGNWEDAQLITANSPLSIDVSDCSYIKLGFSVSANYTVVTPKVKIGIIGSFGDDWDVFNVRPSDGGYHRIIVHPNVTNPNCCDAITPGVQDSEQLLTDYGVICLPEQYRNVGKPTRLIIYCHGAAVNYSDSVTRFNSVDLEPEYWLSEGYAVMDVEGNPFNNTDEHFYTPQAMDCYVAAYKWAIEHYNLCRDGVFLGGRSMGGGNTLNLITPECPIPVIAACPNVPGFMPIWIVQYMTAARKSFFAVHCGFTGTTPAWTNQGVLSADEWQYFKDNFVKFAKNEPLWRLIQNLPTKSVLMDDDLNSSNAATRLAKTQEIYNDLIIKVKCPVKIFGATDDDVATPAYNSVLLQKMLENGANICETRWYQTSLHHYDTQDPSLRVTVTNSYGVEMTDVPSVYVEMLQFWRRYEQGN